MNYTTLEKNKKLVIKARRKCIVLLAPYSFFLLSLIVLTIWRRITDWRVALFLLGLSILVIPFVQDLVRANLLIKQISFIEDNKKINNVYNVKFDNSKVRLLPYMNYRFHSLTHPYYTCYGVYLFDKTNRRYYILYKESKKAYSDDLRIIISMFSREFTLQCYEGTTIVKTVDNAPFCLEDKYTPVYKPFIKK